MIRHMSNRLPSVLPFPFLKAGEIVKQCSHAQSGGSRPLVQHQERLHTLTRCQHRHSSASPASDQFRAARTVAGCRKPRPAAATRSSYHRKACIVMCHAGIAVKAQRFHHALAEYDESPTRQRRRIERMAHLLHLRQPAGRASGAILAGYLLPWRLAARRSRCPDRKRMQLCAE